MFKKTQKKSSSLRSENLILVLLGTQVFWDVMLCYQEPLAQQHITSQKDLDHQDSDHNQTFYHTTSTCFNNCIYHAYWQQYVYTS
jgi:hypothetical protein